MISYAARFFTRAEHSCLRDARSIVARLPSEHDGKELRCHEVARVVARLLELPVVDGRYGPVEHSWLLTRPERVEGPPEAPKSRPAILDVYSVGRLPLVCLIEYFPILPHVTAYDPGEPRDDIRHAVVEALLAPFLEDDECPVHGPRCTPGWQWPEAQDPCPYRLKNAPTAAMKESQLL